MLQERMFGKAQRLEMEMITRHIDLMATKLWKQQCWLSETYIFLISSLHWDYAAICS